MSRDDWYKNKHWDKEIEEAFEARLKRARKPYNKALYLRTQAAYLLYSNDSAMEQKGIEFMERLVREYPEVTYVTIFSYEQLGDYYFTKGDFKRAGNYYQVVTDHYNTTNSRNGTTGFADLKLAEIIIATNNKSKYDMAYKITRSFPVEYLIEECEKYFYTYVRALLSFNLKFYLEAQVYAEIALEIAVPTDKKLAKKKAVDLSEEDMHHILMLNHIAFFRENDDDSILN